ncbi:RNA methyltransferase [Runella aurantiaca]|uniref:TrmH family RNA methyltransferase n=1 Tax=Runella aurantiaca TaxID=2282308 RepID=A0A369IG66_9BACT|nr:RNA methyltransferase [Runella aurantiaca]RDB05646.1 TrmH family RNA methyltransferase [Runella aurantiaca]
MISPRKVSMEELNRLSADEYLLAPKHSFVFVLDDIRSLNNVGSVFRTSDAFRAEKIYLCGLTGTPPHRDITKTALGADTTVVWEHVLDVLDLVARLKAEGYKVVALEQAEGSTKLQDFTPELKQKYAFVLGNEVFGVNEEVVSQADICLEIPQFGTKHSLNVSVSAGIVAWDYVSKMLKS